MGEERITPAGWLPPVATRIATPPPPTAPAGRNRRAVWALVLSITGLALLLLSLGTLFPVTLPCSAGGWILAAKARGQRPGGDGQITAALWIARIGVLVGVMAAVAFIVLLASGFDLEQFRDDLQRDLEDRQQRRSTGVRA